MTVAVAIAPAERAALFGLLADPLRLRIVELLAGEELCTCHLIAETGAKQTTVSHHLRILREAGAVTATEVGKFTWYRLSPHLLDVLGASLTELAGSAQRAGRHRVPCAP
ncbi:MAG: ArsR/SmtB family transcription factor [Candidatus Dormibacteria bacterium]